MSPGELRRARKNFYFLIFFNVISLTVVSENIVTLYALRLGANSLLVGLISSFLYFGFLAMLIGRALALRMGMVRLYGTFWLIRYLMLIPVLFAPLLAAQFPHAALLLLAVCIFNFHFIRGIGVTGYNPVLGEIAGDKDRGAFLARVQTIVHLVTPAVGVAMGFLLGKKAPLHIYSVFIGVGILTGFVATYMIFKLPEPPRDQGSTKQNAWGGFSKAFARPPFRKFILIQFFSLLLVFMVTPFLVLYAKKIYLAQDSHIIFIAVAGSFGALLMSLVSGFLIDKLGAKPLFFIYTAILTTTLVPLIIAPAISNQIVIWIFLAFIFFTQFMGRFGLLNACQTYFFSVIKPEERLNLGIAYFLTIGIAGGIGSMAGGVILTALQNLVGDQRTGFRVFFLVLVALLLLMLLFIRKLDSAGAYPIRNVVNVIFSPRDLRAVSLTHRLRRSTTEIEDQYTIKAMGESQSRLSASEILSKLGSPRFSIRVAALTALSKLPDDRRITQALISEVKNKSFTTAYMAAGILGQRNTHGGVKVLRKNLYSGDFFLAGKCMVSLAKLGDRSSIADIEAVLRQTQNPRLVIHAAMALEIFKNVSSIPLLLAKLERRTTSHLRDEIMLSLAGILAFGSWFYPLYVAFLERSKQGLAGLLHFLIDNPGGSLEKIEAEKLLAALPRDRAKFAELAQQQFSRLSVTVDNIDLSEMLREAVADERLNKLDRFCFLIAAAIVWFSRASTGSENKRKRPVRPVK